MAYSQDIRWKVVQAYENKEGSMEKLAKRFSVSKRFVNDIVQLYRKTGSVDPKPHGGGKTAILSENSGYEKLKLLVEENNELTDQEYSELLQQRFQIFASRQTVNRAFAKLGITKKKELSSQ